MLVIDEGSLCLSIIRGCFDGTLVGYQTSIRLTMDPVEHTLLQVCEKHYPHVDGSLVLYSDRGVHYRSRV